MKFSSLSRPDEKTSLHQAVYNNDLATLMNILSVAPHLINKPDNKGITPLHFATHFERIAAIQILIDSNADINAKDFTMSCTPLMHAIIYNKPASAIALLSNGAGVDEQCKNGYTALHIAATYNNIQILRLLITFDANPLILANYSEKAIELSQSPEIKSRLEAHQNSFMHRHAIGMSPLNAFALISDTPIQNTPQLIVNALVIENVEAMVIEHQQYPKGFADLGR